MQVIFHYVGYNESGRRIDSTYLQGTPAKIRMGTNGLVPGEIYYIYVYVCVHIKEFFNFARYSQCEFQKMRGTLILFILFF